MTKLSLLAALLLTSTGCAEALGDGASIFPGGSRASYSDDAQSPAAHVVARDAAPREFAHREHARHGADFVECAQCRR